jgi:hypothetical protein
MRPEPRDRCEAQGRCRPGNRVAPGHSRRPDCSSQGGSRGAGRSPGQLAFTIRVLPLEGPEADNLRTRQLAVIVRLLRRASAQARRAEGGSEI